MKSTIVVFIILFLHLSASGSQIKHPSVSVFSNTVRFLDLYRKDHAGNLPENWQEFASSGYMTEDILNDTRKYFNMEDRFQFVNPPVAVSHRGENFSVVFMENEPSGRDALEKEERWLAIQHEDGTLRATRYPESVLNRLFKEAGSDLSLYTKESPPPPVVHPRVQPKPRGTGIDSSGNSTLQKFQRVARSLNPFSQRASTASARSDSRPSWVLWLIGSVGGILLIAVAVIIFRRKSRSRMARN